MSGSYASAPGIVMDGVYVRIRIEIGEVISTIHIGGPSNTTALDIIANLQGVFVLMDYHPGLLPHP